MLARTFNESSFLNIDNNNGILKVIWPVVEMEDLLFLSSMFAVPLANASLLMVIETIS